VTTRAGTEPPEAPGTEPRPWLPDGFGVGLMVFVVVAALELLRQQGNPSYQSMWAEDAKYYATDAIRAGALTPLFRGYAGYLQLPPRVVAAFVPLIPIRDLPLYFALVGVLVGTLLAWFLYVVTEGWISSRLLRLALAVLLVLMPAAAKENTANVVNLIWTFVAVLPWAIVSLKEQRTATGVRSVVAFLAATSSPLAALFLPLALVWALVHRTRSAMVVGASLLAGLVVQAGVTLRSTQRVSKAGDTIPHLIQTLLARVGAFYVVGTKPVSTYWHNHGPLLMGGSALVLVVMFAVLFPGAGRRAQALAAVFLAYALVVFVVPAWGRGVATLYEVPGGNFHLSSTRFSVIPILLIASAGAVLLAPRAAHRRHRVAARVVLPLFLAQLVVVCYISYPGRNANSVGDNWSQLVDATYARACVGAPPDQIVTIHNHGSNVHLPCSALKP
jgi:hypothetical protein